jgi:hypothetical protein
LPARFQGISSAVYAAHTVCSSCGAVFCTVLFLLPTLQSSRNKHVLKSEINTS